MQSADSSKHVRAMLYITTIVWSAGVAVAIQLSILMHEMLRTDLGQKSMAVDSRHAMDSRSRHQLHQGEAILSFWTCAKLQVWSCCSAQ